MTKASKDGNKKAEELDRLIRETQKRRKSDDFPAHGDNKKDSDAKTD